MRKTQLFKNTIFVSFLLTIFFMNVIGSAVVDPTIKLDDIPAPYSFVVKTDGSNYWGVQYDGDLLYESTNKTTTIQSCVDALTNGGTIFLREVQLPDNVSYGNDILILEDYQGQRKIYSNLGTSLLQQLASDPNTSGWGESEKGRWFYQTTENKIKFWDGTQLQTLPSVIGGFSYTLPPTYTFFKSESTYYAQDDQGNIDYSGSNASAVSISAIENLDHTYPQRIAFKGNLTFTSSIVVENFTVLDLTDAQLNLGANTDLITTGTATNTHSIQIIGGLLNGWNYTGDAIHFNTTADLVPSWRNKIEGTTLKFFKGDGISLYGAGGRSLISDVYVYNCTRGCYLNAPDNKLVNVVVGDCGNEAYYVSGSSNLLTGCKGYGSGQSDITKGSGVVFYGRNSQATGCLFQENYEYGAEIKSQASAISLVGNTYDRNSLGSANTYDGVYVAGVNVSITGGMVKNLYGKSKTQRHGVYIASTASNVKVFGVVEDDLLGDYVYTEVGATDILIDEEMGGSEGESVANRAWSYMCWKNATATYVTNGATGTIDYNNANPVLAFEWAFGQVSGTVREKVVLKGDFSGLTSTIDIATSYLTIEILGRIELADAQNINLFYASSQSNLEFCGGGLIDPNGDGQSSTMHGILLSSCTDSSIHHLTFTGAYGTSGSGDTIRLAECERCSVHDSEFNPYQETYDSVKIRGTGSHDNIVTNNIFRIYEGCNSAGVQISNGAYRNLVSDNTMYIYDVLTDHSSGIKMHDADYNLIANNHLYFYGDPWGGIDIVEDGDFNFIVENWIQGSDHAIWFREITGTPSWNVVKDNYIILRDSTSVGIEFEDTDNSVSQGNTVICSGTTGTQWGVRVESACTDTLVKDNNFDVLLDDDVYNEAGGETSEVGNVDIDFT